jgi:hypothetical protein
MGKIKNQIIEILELLVASGNNYSYVADVFGMKVEEVIEIAETYDEML